MLYIFNIDVFCLVICDMLFALIVCILNARSLKKYIGYKQEIKKSFLFPAICSVLMGVCSYFISQALYRAVKSYAVSVLVTIIASVLIYGILLLLFRVIDDEEIYELIGTGVLDEVNPRSSWRASKEFRLQLISELARRALKEAIQRSLNHEAPLAATMDEERR